MNNARFWVWWNDGFVKLTLRPDQSLEAGYGGPDEEGWHYFSCRWTHEGDHIQRDEVTEGRDCDGRTAHYQTDVCPLDRLAVFRPGRQREEWDVYLGWWEDDPDAPLCPRWEKAEASQYDEYAELAGY